MTDLIDFSNCEKTKKNYEGANGSKICIKYDGELYMLKFPPASTRNKELSYTNGTVSEYIGCHIFESLGFETQKTVLGIYNKGGKEKIVVACKDFTENNKYTIQPFSSLKNTIIDSGHNGTGTELSEVLDAIDKQDSFEPVYLKNYFWDLFIGDALIGNWDRHNGNWASLYDSKTDTVRLAPVYDCGSSMYPSADIKTMKSVLSDKVASSKLIVLDELKFDEIKTKKFQAVLTNLKVEEKALVVLGEKDDVVIKSANNLPSVQTALPNTINVYDVLKAGTLILTKDAVAKIEEVYA